MFGLARARVIMLPLLLAGCHTWRNVPLSSNDSGPLPRNSAVVLAGGERVELENARTTRDSLIGTRPGGARFAVSRDSVNYVEARKVNAVRSIGAGLGGLAIAASVLLVVGFIALMSSLD